MGQKNYNRSYDNDREPQPKSTFRSRMRYRGILIKEWAEDLAAPFKAAKKKRAARAKRAEEKRAEEKRAEKRRKAEQRAKAEAIERAEAEAAEKATARSERYGKDDFTQENHVTGDGLLEEVSGPELGRKRFELTKRCYAYLALLVFAFIFTQALHAKASNIFFGFVCFLPLVLFLYTLTAAFALQMHMASDGATVKKHEPYLYEMRIINQAPLAYPFVEAIMTLPQSNSVRCRERSVYLSMAPMGSYTIKNEVRFRFRGSYRIGVECFYVYDFFRLFRIRVDRKNSVMVRVLPRDLLLGENTAHAVSDEPDLKNRRTASIERVEVGDIRNYLPGDPLKLIHWNLTSRLEDPVVKDYNGGSTKITYIYCDLAARFPEEAPEPPEPTKAEKKALKRAARERKQAEDRKKKAIAYAEKHGDALLDEELRRLDQTRSERKAERRAEKEEARRKKMLSELAVLQKEDPEKAILLRDRLRDAELKRADLARTASDKTDEPEAEEDPALLKDASCYEDMNEYCADGIIDLSISRALRELRKGNEVVLIWQDGRSPSGVCAYAFRAPEELHTVYPLFATAPLTDKNDPLVELAVLAGDTTGMKQIFVTAAFDRESISAFCGMPSFGGAGESAEVVLYAPEHRFRDPVRLRTYLEGCREELMRNGISLTCKLSEPAEERGGTADA